MTKQKWETELEEILANKEVSAPKPDCHGLPLELGQFLEFFSKAPPQPPECWIRFFGSYFEFILTAQEPWSAMVAAFTLGQAWERWQNKKGQNGDHSGIREQDSPQMPPLP